MCTLAETKTHHYVYKKEIHLARRLALWWYYVHRLFNRYSFLAIHLRTNRAHLMDYLDYELNSTKSSKNNGVKTAESIARKIGNVIAKK